MRLSGYQQERGQKTYIWLLAEFLATAVAVLFLFQHRQNITSRIFKPRNHRPATTENTAVVRLQFRLVVFFKTHAALAQLIDCVLNILYRKIQDREVGGLVRG